MFPGTSSPKEERKKTFIFSFVFLLHGGRSSICLTFAVVVQLPSQVRLCNPMGCSTPGFPVTHLLPEFAQVHVQWISDAIPNISSSVTLFSSCPQSFPASGSFQQVSSLHQVAKALELQLQHQSFQRIFRLISFRIDWFDLLAAQETLKSLLKHN